jgi:CHAP domain-containing protein
MGTAKTVCALVAAFTLSSISDALAINCVQYVRESTDFGLRGDAWHWWDSAAGVYNRGHAPRKGAVLVFERTKKMRRGHVAVVSRVVDYRTVLIDHANWASLPKDKGHVDRGVLATDCSGRDDWSAVCVWNKKARAFGSPHPTNGFIYPANSASL